MRATLTLSAAQVAALHDTPVLMVGAPGADQMLLVDYSLWRGASAWNGGATGVGLVYGDGSETQVPADAFALNDQNPLVAGLAVGVGTIGDDFTQSYQPDAGVVSQPLYIAAIDANPAGGSDPVTVVVEYRLITLPLGAATPAAKPAKK